MLKGSLPINTLSGLVSLGSAISNLPATGAVLLAITTGVGIATVPAQAATITYTGCGANATFCTLPQLFAGGSITVDENDDNIVDKTFSNWIRSGLWDASPIRVVASSASTTSAELTFTANPPLTITSPPTGFNSFNNLFLFNVSTTTNPNIALTGINLALTSSTSGGLSAVQVNAPGTGLPNLQAQNALGVVSCAVGNVTPDPSLCPASTPVNYSTLLTFNMSLVGASFFGSTASISQFKIAFQQGSTVTPIPEPSAVVGLLAFCGLSLGLKRKQRDS